MANRKIEVTDSSLSPLVFQLIDLSPCVKRGYAHEQTELFMNNAVRLWIKADS